MAVNQKRALSRQRICIQKICVGRIKFFSLSFLAFLIFVGYIAIAFAQIDLFVLEWGSFGTGDGQFDVVCGVFVDGAGYVYVTEVVNNRVQKFTSDGVFVTKWGSPGSGDGQFNTTYSVAVDSSGYVYVTDYSNCRVQKFTNTGLFVTTWGSFGADEGQFNGVSGVAVDSSGYVYVTDWYNDRVQKFTGDGVFVTKWGSPGSGDGQFNGPKYVAVDSSGYVYVTDQQENGRVQKFTGDGVFVTKWGIYGTGDGQFNGVSGVAVDSSGDVYVVDYGNCRVQKFTSTGTFVTKLGSLGSGDGEFDNPWGVAVDNAGNLYVADSGNHRIQKFALESSEINYTFPAIIIIGVAASVFGLSFFWWKKYKKPRTNVKSPSSSTQPEIYAPKSLNHLFISHVEEDAKVALEIAENLDKAGYTTWCYENNSVPGLSYLLQTKQAIEQSQAVIVVISPNSLSSRQVTLEVVRAHESGKPFIPVLLGISHIEFQQRQPEWHAAIGSVTSILIPKQGVSVILSRLIRGLKRLGVKKV